MRRYYHLVKNLKDLLTPANKEDFVETQYKVLGKIDDYVSDVTPAEIVTGNNDCFAPVGRDIVSELFGYQMTPTDAAKITPVMTLGEKPSWWLTSTVSPRSVD